MENEVKFPNVRSEMARKGLRQIDLSDQMSSYGLICKPSSLSHKLKGNRSFTIPEMSVIAAILGKDPTFLFFNIEYTKCVPMS